MSYGSRVLGEMDFAIQERQREIAGDQYGPRVMGDAPSLSDIAKTVVQEQIKKPTFSLAEIAEFLQKQPALLDDLVLSEMDRPEGPRVEATRLFITAAENAARDAEYIKGLLAMLPEDHAPAETPE